MKKVCKTSLLLLVFLALPIACLGAENSEDLLSGFDDENSVAEEIEEIQAVSPSLFSGFVKTAAGINIAHDSPEPGKTDWRGLSKFRGEFLLEAHYQFKGWKFFGSTKGFYELAYLINGRDDYADQVLDEYENELELRELFLQGNILPSLDIKMGRQIVAWGRSDNFRVTDILNPLDNREPGLTDIEDLRLPLTMTKVDYYYGEWNLDLIAVHEHRYDKVPVFGHDFYLYPFPAPEDNKPARTFENTELALDLNGTFSGWDISFYYAYTFNDQANFVPGPGITTEHRRLNVIGTAASLAWDDFLLIGEAAHLRGLGFMVDPADDYDRTDILVGVEYSGFTETVISCDYLYKKLHDYNTLLTFSPESPVENDEQLALRISRDFMHDTITATGLIMMFGDHAQRGAMERLTLKWDVADNWSTTLGVVFYESGDTDSTAIGDNDRVFAELRYDF